MDVTIRRFEPADAEQLQTLLQSPGITDQYPMYAGPDGAARMLADPDTPREGVHLAFADGEPAGFACAFVLPGTLAPWALLRGAVLPAFRRNGIGRALHDVVRRYAFEQRQVPGIREVAISAWEPAAPAEAMVAALGYGHDRWFWLMERARAGASPEPAWPAGVTVRVHDGSESSLADWNEAYNRSFAEHHRFVPGTVEYLREFVKKPGFRADALLLAYRNGRVAGFCRNDLLTMRGEVNTLGTVPEARGIGLGRALLRWGVAWLERECTLPVSLLVDGANDGALALYRSEAFAVTRTRRMWARRADEP